MPRFVLNYDLRHPAQFGVSGPDLYAAALDQIAWADGLGFDMVAFGEHHQSPDGYIPAPLVFAAAVGGRTRRIRVRVSVLLGLLYDPIRLAEEIAVVDLCLGGRLDVGIGVGYVREDFAMFGADYDRRGPGLEELVALLRLAWTGEPFEYRGATVRVTPRPAQDPMPIHLGGSIPRAIERAARLGDGYFPPMPAFWSRYRRACVAAGKPDPGALPPNGPIFTWVTREDPDAVWERLTPHILHQIHSYAEWTAAAYGEPMGPFVPDRRSAEVLDDVRQGGAYRVVSPEEAVELARGLGPDGRFNLSPLLAGIDPEWSWAMLRCVETEVLPHVGS